MAVRKMRTCSRAGESGGFREDIICRNPQVVFRGTHQMPAGNAKAVLLTGEPSHTLSDELITDSAQKHEPNATIIAT